MKYPEPKVFPRTSLMSDSQFAAFVADNPVGGGKEDSEIKMSENEQLGFNRMLKDAFSQRFANQTGLLNFLNNKLTAQVNNPTGLAPTTEASLRTGATEQAARDFAHAQQATQAGEAARGGSTLPSGVEAQLRAENQNAAAAENTRAQTGISLTNEQVKQDNYWKAVAGLSGVSAQESSTPYAGEYNQGSGEVANLGAAYSATKQSPVLATLGGIAGAGISAVGTYFANKPQNNDDNSNG